jgi:hypothetical protein
MSNRPGGAIPISRIAIGCLAIAGAACSSESSSSSKADSARIANDSKAASTVPLARERRLMYARSQDSLDKFGWLMQLGPGNSGKFFAAFPIEVCSVRRSDAALAFETASDGGHSFTFAGKLTDGALVGPLVRVRAGPIDTTTESFGIARLVPLDTARASEALFNGRTGFYSDFRNDSGDALGSQVVLFVAGGERMLLFSQAEGSRSYMEPGFDLKIVGDTVSFSVGQGPHPRHLSVVLQRDRILLRDPDAYHYPKEGIDTLPREHTIEKLFDEPAFGTCQPKT